MCRYILSLFILFCSFGIIYAETIFEASGIVYKITSDNTVNIVSQKAKHHCLQIFKDSLLIVPAHVKHEGKEYKVQAIERASFKTCCGIKKVIISEGIEEIMDKAFVGCANLEAVHLPSSIRTIGENVFSYCISLQSITVDGNNPVFDSRNECNAIIRTADNTLLCACKATVIPSSVENINSYAFVGFTMKAIDIPVGVKTIREYAIYNCMDIEQITIPSSVVSIEYSAINSCDNLKYLSVDNDNATYDSRNGCNAIIETDAGFLVLGCNTSTIPSGVSVIGEAAFQSCKKLRAIKIPEGVEVIMRNAFYDCLALKTVELPSSLLTFDGRGHFDYCTSLDSIYIPQHVDEIPSGIFMGCVSLRRVIVDKRNKKYDSRNNCNAIIGSSHNELIAGCKSSEIVNGITSINENAFYKSGITSIHIPASVEYIDSTAFRESKYCQAITVDENNPIYKSAGSNSIAETVSGKLVLACSTTNILPEVTSIGGYAYLNTPEDLVLPSGIKIINNGAFTNCEKLQTIIIPKTVNNIGRFAFFGCTQLSDVILMGNQVKIDKQAFDGCVSYKQ